MEKVHRKVKKGEEEKDYHYWLSRPMDERFDCVAQLLQLYFEMHPDVPQRLQGVHTIIHKKSR